MDVGRVAERVDDLEGAGLLSLDPERVDRVHDHDRRASGKLAHDLERDVEVAAHLEDLGAVHERLGELAERDVALGDEHDAGACPARAA